MQRRVISGSLGGLFGDYAAAPDSLLNDCYPRPVNAYREQYPQPHRSSTPLDRKAGRPAKRPVSLAFVRRARDRPGTCARRSDDTDARKATVRRFGRSDRSAQNADRADRQQVAAAPSVPPRAADSLWAYTRAWLFERMHPDAG